MKTQSARVILFFVAVFCLSSAAQEIQTLTPQKAIQEALGFSLEVKNAKARVEQSSAQFSVNESRLLPSLDLRGVAGSQRLSSGFIGGGGINGEVETYRGLLVLSQPLYVGGALFAGLSLGKVTLDSAKQELFSSKQDCVFEAMTAYYDSAENQRLLQLAQENREVLKSYAQITANYASIGRSKNIDRLTAEASYQLSESEVLQSEVDHERALARLHRWLGWENNPSTLLETEMPLQPVEIGSIGELYNKAVENNPAIRSAELQVQMQTYANDITMAEFRPRLTLDATMGYESLDRPNFFDQASRSYGIFLNLNIPLFYGFRSFSQRSLNSQLRVQKENDLRIRQRDLHRSLSQSLATIDREFRKLKLTQTAAQSARKAMDVALKDYRQGLLSSIDVLNIQRTRFDAEKQFLRAQFSYRKQVLSLRKDLGIDLEKTYAQP